MVVPNKTSLILRWMTFLADLFFATVLNCITWVTVSCSDVCKLFCCLYADACARWTFLRVFTRRHWTLSKKLATTGFGSRPTQSSASYTTTGPTGRACRKYCDSCGTPAKCVAYDVEIFVYNVLLIAKWQHVFFAAVDTEDWFSFRLIVSYL